MNDKNAWGGGKIDVSCRTRDLGPPSGMSDTADENGWGDSFAVRVRERERTGYQEGWDQQTCESVSFTYPLLSHLAAASALFDDHHPLHDIVHRHRIPAKVCVRVCMCACVCVSLIPFGRYSSTSPPFSSDTTPTGRYLRLSTLSFPLQTDTSAG